MPKKLSKSQQVSEYLKCKQSFDYFCRNYVFIELAGGDVLFQPYKKQSELIDYIEKNKTVIVLKSRQIGISTIIKSYCSWLVTFFDNTVIGIISKDGAEATDFARGIRGMVEKLPDWLRPNFEKQAEQSFILSNGSKTFAATVNPTAPEKTLRGKAITFLVIDEAAFISKVEEAWTSMVPALSTAQKQARKVGVPYGTIILSTPNKTTGKGKWFYDKYTSAIAQEENSDEIEIGKFNRFVIHWRDISELASDPSWYKSQCNMFDNDKKKIEQELELKFLPSGGSFFSEDICIKLQNGVREPLRKSRLFNGEAWVFEEPIEGVFYIIGVDTASQYGKDNSAINIFNYETLEQVWEYRGKLEVREFCKIVLSIASLYPGTIVVENNSYGNQVVETIKDSEYSMSLYREKRGETIIAPGLSNNSKTRPLMIDALYTYVTQYPECVKSERTALELCGLVEKSNGRVEAEDENTRDDLALAHSFICYVRKYDPPLMIAHSKAVSNEFESVLGMNNDSYNFQKSQGSTEINALREINALTIKKIKSSEIKQGENFINVLNFYNRG